MSVLGLPRAGWRGRPWAQGTVAFALYLALATALIGSGRLSAPASGTIGSGPDVQIFVWGLRWWPYAIAHGLDPFVTHLLWPPAGVSTLWTTTVPALALLGAPVTLLAGPLVTWNVWCVLAPTFAAWGAYLLCRELDSSWGPALAGGLLFGFSAYESAQGLAHLQLTACAAVPLTAREFVRLARGRASQSRTAGRIAVLVCVQALISVEVLTTMALAGALLAVGAAVVSPASRPQVARLTRTGLLAAALSTPITAPVLIEMLRHAPPHALNPTRGYSLDLLNLVLPTRQTMIGGSWAAPITSRFTGNLAEQDGYLGVPLLTITALYLWTHRRRPLAWLLVTTAILSLGPRLQVAGHGALPLPAAVLRQIPLLADVLPDRLALYPALTTAVIAALWLTDSRTGSHASWALAVAAAVAILPRGAGWQSAPRPPGQLTAGAVVISLPFWDVHDRTIELQAEDDLRYALVDRWIQDTPSSLRPFAHTPGLYGRDLPSHRDPAFVRVLCAHHITAVIVWPGPESARIARALAAPVPSGDHPSLSRLDCPPSAAPKPQRVMQRRHFRM